MTVCIKLQKHNIDSMQVNIILTERMYIEFYLQLYCRVDQYKPRIGTSATSHAPSENGDCRPCLAAYRNVYIHRVTVMALGLLPESSALYGKSLGA